MSAIINASSLILEVTRKCNLHCAHCLRGDAQCVDMSKSTIDKLMPMLGKVSSVTFTGGEPSFNTGIIEYFFKRFEETHSYVPSFFVATNGIGKERQLELCRILMEAYANMDEGDRECCGIAISRDEFHDDSDVCNIAKALCFYDNSKDMSNQQNSDWCIPEGRAMENGIGANERKMKPDFYIDNEDDFIDGDTPDVEMLYISAKEEVNGECDFSYEDIDEEKLCTLDTLPAYLEHRRREFSADDVVS